MEIEIMEKWKEEIKVFTFTSLSFLLHQNLHTSCLHLFTFAILKFLFYPFIIILSFLSYLIILINFIFYQDERKYQKNIFMKIILNNYISTLIFPITLSSFKLL